MTTETAESQAAAPASQADAGTASVQDEAASILAALDEGTSDAAEETESQTTESTEAAADGTDAEPEDLEDLLKTEVRESIAEKARADALKELEAKQQAEAKEREKKQAETSRREGYRQSFQGRAPAIRAWAEEQGLPREETDKLVNTFNLHHRDAIEVASWELTDKLVETFRNRLPESERESFTYDGTNDDLNAFISDYDARITKEARKGYLSEAEVKQRVADEKVAMLVKLRENPSLLNARGGPRRSAGGAAGRGAVTYNTKTEARNLHANNQLSNAEMRQVNADPSIPE